ncbi:uncharacterized protein LOC106168744 [Lingula anatina]|uniref:Uncharacterized protein LOC106168744 n=1 Tax=Lingula anatina TaxID=7574 RepID=A0A1S3IZC7_LINAN|nr:uncharacterized protein LOC106168744 [Lingula anatina]|eukprot:XP_013403368.1 uncharacterized protein LOC106168744 [Lingula anatina]
MVDVDDNDVILLLEVHDKDFVEKQVKAELEKRKLRCLLRTELDNGTKLGDACQRRIIIYSGHALGNNSWKHFLMDALESRRHFLFLLVHVKSERAPLVIMEFNYITTTRPLWKEDLVHFATSGSITSMILETNFLPWIYNDLSQALRALLRNIAAPRQPGRLRMTLAASSTSLNTISLVCRIDDAFRVKEINYQLEERGVECSVVHILDETKDILSFDQEQLYCVVIFLPEGSEQFKKLVKRGLKCISVVLDNELSPSAVHRISHRTESFLVPDKDVIRSLIQAITGYMPPNVYLTHLSAYCRKLVWGMPDSDREEPVTEMRQLIRSIRMHTQRYREPCSEKERSHDVMPLPGSSEEDVFKRLSECLFDPDWYSYLKHDRVREAESHGSKTTGRCVLI